MNKVKIPEKINGDGPIMGIIVPIQNGEIVFDEIQSKGINLTEKQIAELLALAFSHLDLKQKSKLVLDPSLSVSP